MKNENSHVAGTYLKTNTHLCILKLNSIEAPAAFNYGTSTEVDSIHQYGRAQGGGVWRLSCHPGSRFLDGKDQFAYFVLYAFASSWFQYACLCPIDVSKMYLKTE